MNIGINPQHFQKAALWEEDRNLFETFDLVSDAGFKCLDFSIGDRVTAEKVAEYISLKGITVNQSHMPMNRYAKKDFEEFKKDVMCHAENAKLMGSKILVVHGDEYDYSSVYSRQTALEFNYKLSYDLVDFAAKNGMKVAFENVFDEKEVAKGWRYCSFVDDLCDLVDKYKSDHVGICWDTGHASAQYKYKNIEAMRVAGKRIIATHIHDNIYDLDLHMFPFLGEINWKELMLALKEIGYEGDFSLELVYDRIPKALAPDYLKVLYKSAEYLVNLV